MRELSIFVDESGDFGKFCENSQIYIVSFIFHEQNNSIAEQIKNLNISLDEMGLNNHTIYTAPLIRREQSYKNFDIQIRRKIFYKLFCFTRHINISYASIIAKKYRNSKSFEISRQLAKQLSEMIRDNLQYFLNLIKS